MHKPLYLDGTRAPLEVLIDGPALRIRRPEQADARAPLRIVGRIVVSGRVTWQTEAILACMDAAIPIAFLSADGTPRGWCLGAAEGADDINALLEEATLHRDWPGRHADWVRAMERNAVLEAICALDVQPSSLRPVDVWAACEAAVAALHAPVPPPILVGTLKGLVTAQVAEELRRAGVAARFASGHGAPVRLIDDLASILVWGLWPRAYEIALYFCRHGDKHALPAVVRRRIVRRYEALAPRVAARFRDLFWRLRWHVREIRG